MPIISIVFMLLDNEQATNAAANNCGKNLRVLIGSVINMVKFLFCATHYDLMTSVNNESRYSRSHETSSDTP